MACHLGNPLQDNEGFHYAVVDMRLNGGRGAVVRKNTVLLPRSTERLAGTMHANGRDYWVVTQELESYAFHAFPVTCEGVGEPVISPAADNLRDTLFKDRFFDYGMIKISPDGKRLAISHDESSIAGFVDVYRFDPVTGAVRDSVHIPHPGFGIAFSPSGERLYTNSLGARQLYQYDLTLPTGAEIASSRIDLGRVGIGYAGTMQLGIDGKLYVVSEGFSPTLSLDSIETIISVVEKPDERGAACDFRYRAIVFPPRGWSISLPNNIDHYLFGQKRTCEPEAGFEVEGTTICGGREWNVTDRSSDANDGVRWLFPGGQPSEWSGPDPPAVVYDTPGRYVVKQIAVADICTGKLSDTAEVEVLVNPSPTVDAGRDIALCTEDSVLLAGRGTGEALTWHWSPAEGLSCVDCPTPMAMPERTTSYALEVRNSFGCTATDTVTVWRGRQSVALRIDVGGAVREPGDTVHLPVVMEGTTEGEYVRELRLRVNYDSSMFIPLKIAGSEEDVFSGTLLEGWSITTLRIAASELAITARTSGAAVQLKQGDTLLRLPGTVYLGGRATAWIELTAESPDLACATIERDTAEVPMNVCGLHLRLIEFGSGKYVPPRAVPNPASGRVRIGFGLGLDGSARLEIFDVGGKRVGLLVDGLLEAGTYTVEWETWSVGAGVYWLRLTSGDWSATERVIVQ